MSYEICWELIPHTIMGQKSSFNFYRLKVPGGWILMIAPQDKETGATLTFYPDTLHGWEFFDRSSFEED